MVVAPASLLLRHTPVRIKISTKDPWRRPQHAPAFVHSTFSTLNTQMRDVWASLLQFSIVPWSRPYILDPVIDI